MSDRGTELNHLQIPEVEKQNIRNLESLLEKASKDLKYSIETHVVGGVLTKEWSRKDIDLLCTIQNVRDRFSYGTALDRAEASFKILEEITQEALVDKGQFKIEQLIKPYLDHEYENPEILAHNGSIVVRPLEGTAIEIVNNSR